MDDLVAEGDAHLNVHSWNVEDCGLHVIGFGLQGGGTFLASQEMGVGGIGGLQLLLLWGRLLVKTPDAALTVPVKPTGKERRVLSHIGLFMLYSLQLPELRHFCVSPVKASAKSHLAM